MESVDTTTDAATTAPEGPATLETRIGIGSNPFGNAYAVNPSRKGESSQGEAGRANASQEATPRDDAPPADGQADKPWYTRTSADPPAAGQAAAPPETDDAHKVATPDIERYFGIPEADLSEADRQMIFVSADGKTKYRDLPSLYAGVEAKQQYIERQHAENTALQERLAAAERDLALYRDRLPEEQILSDLIAKHLPDEFKGDDGVPLTEDDLTDARDLMAFGVAHAEAERKAKEELDAAKNGPAESARQWEQKAQEAASHVEGLLTHEFFGVTPGDIAEEARVGDAIGEMTAELGGHSPMQVATLVGATFEPAVGALVLEALRARVHAKRIEAMESVTRGMRSVAPHAVLEAPTTRGNGAEPVGRPQDEFARGYRTR